MTRGVHCTDFHSVNSCCACGFGTLLPGPVSSGFHMLGDLDLEAQPLPCPCPDTHTRRPGQCQPAGLAPGSCLP